MFLEGKSGEKWNVANHLVDLFSIVEGNFLYLNNFHGTGEDL